MPTIKGSPTLREQGQRLIEFLENETYSSPYEKLSPQWFWKLGYEGGKIPLLASTTELLTVVTMSPNEAMSPRAVDSCSVEFGMQLMVFISKRLYIPATNDIGDNDELNALMTLAQEIGESLVVMAGGNEQGGISPLPLFDQSLAEQERIFLSNWMVDMQ